MVIRNHRPSPAWRQPARSLEALEPRRLLAVLGEIEPNDSEATAQLIDEVAVDDVITVAHDDWTSLQGSISANADADYYMFEIEAQGQGNNTGVFIDIDAVQLNTPFPELDLTNMLDSEITVYSIPAQGPWVQIGANDDGYDFEGLLVPGIEPVPAYIAGVNYLDAALYLDKLAPGFYGIRVNSFMNQSNGDYELRILQDRNYTTQPPSLSSFTNQVPTSPDFPNNILFLDFRGEFFNPQNNVQEYLSFDPQLNQQPYTFTNKSKTLEPVFTPADRLAMYNIWRIVAEDFYPFQVNVTTQNLILNNSYQDGMAYRMLVTSYNPTEFQASPTNLANVNYAFPATAFEDEEFDTGFTSLLGASIFDSWAEGGGDVFTGGVAQRNDQLGYIFAANHNNFLDNNSGLLVAAPVQIAETISHEFGHALGLRHFDTGNNPWIMQNVILARDVLPPPNHCPSADPTFRRHDDPNGTHGERLVRGLHRAVWGTGPACDTGQAQDDIATIIGTNDSQAQQNAVARDNTIRFRADDFGDVTAFSLGVLDNQNLEIDGFLGQQNATGTLGDIDTFSFRVIRPTTVTVKVDVDEYVNNLDSQVQVTTNNINNPFSLSDNPPGDVYDAEVTALLQPDTYIVRVSPGGRASEIGQYTLRIMLPDPPQARPDSATTDEDMAVTVDVLMNDDAGDGVIQVDTVTVVTRPRNGTAVPNANGTITYTPNANFFGTDTFTYTVANDVGGASNQATVSILVNPLDDPPVAVDDTATVNLNSMVVIDVLANDFDPDAQWTPPQNDIDPTTVNIVTGPATGTIMVNPATGAVTYTPNAAFFGTDTFTYEVSDDDTPSLTSNTATVTIKVNQPPTAVDDMVSTDEDTAVVIDVAANDTDADGMIVPGTVTIVTQPTNGTITSINPTTGEVTYEPTPNFSGADSFTYTIADNDGAVSAAATVNITVNFINDPPVAFDDVATTAVNTAVVIDVLANDTDADPETTLATVMIVASPQHGAAVVNGDGTVTYTPGAGFAGGDRFTYRAVDSLGAVSTNVATVDIRVGAPVSISGFTFVDFNDNLVREYGAGDLPMASVTVRVEKTDGPLTFVMTAITDVNGQYTFQETAGVNLMPAGVYRITEVHPSFMVDGRESAGSGNANPAGNPVVVGNDVFSNVIMAAGGSAVNFNFGELGLRAQFVQDFLNGGLFSGARPFLASSGPGGIAPNPLASINLAQGDVVLALSEGFRGTRRVSAELSSAPGTATITLYDENVNPITTAHSSGGSAALDIVGAPGKPRFIRISGNHPDVHIEFSQEMAGYFGAYFGDGRPHEPSAAAVSSALPAMMAFRLPADGTVADPFTVASIGGSAVMGNPLRVDTPASGMNFSALTFADEAVPGSRAFVPAALSLRADHRLVSLHTSAAGSQLDYGGTSRRPLRRAMDSLVDDAFDLLEKHDQRRADPRDGSPAVSLFRPRRTARHIAALDSLADDPAARSELADMLFFALADDDSAAVDQALEAQLTWLVR